MKKATNVNPVNPGPCGLHFVSSHRPLNYKSQGPRLPLIVDDPDAPDPRRPRMVWVHRVLYNLPPSAKGLPESVQPENLPAGTRQGKNGWKKTGYRGPCPPIGRHRYYFKLYALDTVLPDLGNPTKAQLLKAMKGHVLATAELMGTYEK